jgi:hypothetical protein
MVVPCGSPPSQSIHLEHFEDVKKRPTSLVRGERLGSMRMEGRGGEGYLVGRVVSIGLG